MTNPASQSGFYLSKQIRMTTNSYQRNAITLNFDIYQQVIGLQMQFHHTIIVTG